jgi:hypothetical protein
MIVIRDIPQDPPSMVLQGRVIGDVSAMDRSIAMADEASVVFDSTCLFPILQGQVIGDYVPKTVVPAAMIGQHDWYGIKPRQTGPMRMAGGKIEMLDIGQPIPDFTADPFVDPIRRFLKSDLDIDKTGALMVLWDSDVLGASEAVFEVILADPEPMGNPVVTIPRGAVYRSGLSKRITSVILPSDFGSHFIDSFTESTQTFLITGITKDKNGAALGNCTVVVMQVDDSTTPVNTVLFRTVSDGTGNFTLSVHQAGGTVRYQISAFLNGSPDVGGMSDNTLQASDTPISVYLYDVTILAGGSLGYPVINSGLVRSA